MTPVGFRLVTLNTWKCDGAYRQRMALMAPGLRALAPDAVALQECFVADDGSADTAGLLCAATGLRSQAVRARHKRRAFEGREVASWSCQTVLHAHPVLRSEALLLPSPPGDDDRLAQLVRLDVQGFAVTLANVHLTHLPEADAPGWRARQLQAVRDALEGWGPCALTVVCGDFNADLNSASLQGFMRGPDALQDAFARVGQDRTPTFFDDLGQGRVLDHVLVVPALSQARIDAVSADTVLRADRPDERGIAPSDHSGLLMALRLS